MKRYLRELEVAGMLMIVIGIVIAHTAGFNNGAWPCGFGMLLLLVPFCYKAFHWTEYERENKNNIVIIVIAIVLLLLQMILLLR